MIFELSRHCIINLLVYNDFQPHPHALPSPPTRTPPTHHAPNLASSDAAADILPRRQRDTGARSSHRPCETLLEVSTEPAYVCDAAGTVQSGASGRDGSTGAYKIDGEEGGVGYADAGGEGAGIGDERVCGKGWGIE